jgi:hypothetical protein
VVTTVGLALGAGSDTLTVTNGGAVDIGSGTSTIAGAVHVGSSASIGGAGTINANLVNDGGVTATGTLDVNGAVTGSGTFTVNTGTHLEFGSSVAASDNVSFQSATGSLILDHSSGFAALISGFSGNGMLSGSDQIDLKDINYNSLSESFDQASQTLSISDGSNSATLHFVGSYVAQNFKFASDGSGGTIVYDPPVPSGGANVPSRATPPAAFVHGDGFKFVNVGPVDAVGHHPDNLPAPGDYKAWPASDHQGTHDGVENVGSPHDISHDTHDQSHNPMLHTEFNMGHFHLI